MVIFLYACKKCNKEFDLKYPIGKAPKHPKCPECRYRLSRIFTPIGNILKGSGFYRNQNKHKEALGKDKEGNWKYDKLRKYDGTI